MRRFAYRLALRLGWANVDQMLRNMSSQQLSEWMAFYELEPFGEDREEARIGQVVQVLANANRDSKKRKTPYSLEDVVLKPCGDMFQKKAEKKPQSWQSMKLLAEILSAASGKE